MNIQAIQMFVCVAEELSFSRAAEKLFVSQPAISKQIQQMERELGVTLLKRDRHQVRLTPAGAASSASPGGLTPTCRAAWGWPITM